MGVWWSGGQSTTEVRWFDHRTPAVDRLPATVRNHHMINSFRGMHNLMDNFQSNQRCRNHPSMLDKNALILIDNVRKNTRNSIS